MSLTSPKNQGINVNPHTRYAFWSWGLPTTWANTGRENESVIFSALVALSDTLVTENLLQEPYTPESLKGTAPTAAFQSRPPSLNGAETSTYEE